MKKNLLSIHEACEKYGLTRSTLSCAIGRGALKQKKIDRHSYVDEADIKDYVANHAGRLGRPRERKKRRMSAKDFANLPMPVGSVLGNGSANLRLAALDAMCLLVVLDACGDNRHISPPSVRACIDKLRAALGNE